MQSGVAEPTIYRFSLDNNQRIYRPCDRGIEQLSAVATVQSVIPEQHRAKSRALRLIYRDRMAEGRLNQMTLPFPILGIPLAVKALSSVCLRTATPVGVLKSNNTFGGSLYLSDLEDAFAAVNGVDHFVIQSPLNGVVLDDTGEISIPGNVMFL
jgi:hypothetical protein